MKTIKEEWDGYRASCYPHPVPKVQLTETELAFHAGALVALVAMKALTQMPTEVALVELNKLFKEAEETCRNIAHRHQARNN